MARIRETNYVTIQSYMVTELKLKGNELIIYAIINGFCQDGEHKFNGSLQYLADWTNSTKQGVMKSLKSLVEKGYIVKNSENINGVNKVEYYTTMFNGGIKQSLTGGIKQSLTNNININNISNNIYNNNIYDFIEENFGRTLNPLEYEEISTWEDNELTRYAIKEAVLGGKYNIKYISVVLNSYKKNSITTVQQAQEEKERFKNKGKKEEPIPSWFNQEIKEEDNLTDEEREWLQSIK